MNRYLLSLLLLSATPLAAHPDPSHTLDQIEEHLAQTPDDPQMLRQKADLLIATRHPIPATPSVKWLMELAPNDPETLLLDARLAVARSQPDGLAKATALTVSHPDFAPGWKFLSDLHHRDGRQDEAINALSRVVNLQAKPDASDVLTCAGWLVTRARPGDDESALAILDQGLAKLSVLTGLHDKAIEIELRLGRTDATLRRLDVLAGRFRPSVELSLRRADILEKAGRHAEAAAACDSALALLDAQPAKRKKDPAWQKRFDTVAKRKQDNLAASGSAGL